LTIVPVLLTLTIEGQRNDTYTASEVQPKHKADEKNQVVLPARTGLKR
jgi:hypothetical protein